jgi:N-acetylmuramoyl-L-alanine amidase
MKLIEKPLTVNSYSRPGHPLGCVKAIIMHWTGAPGQRAINTWGYFESRKEGKEGYGSAHYIIDLDGTVYHAIPDTEVAYHCGSSRKTPDPASGKVYTDWARKHFGEFTENVEPHTPNFCTLGIEMCTLDNDGNFAPATLVAACGLVAKLLKEHGLGLDDIGTHHLVVGWKDCPRLWTNHPEKFEEFKTGVGTLLK